MSMNCASAQELFPWMLNETLSEEDSRQVREHLSDCAECRRELAETREAWTVFNAHIPSETLVDYAWERPVALPMEMLETHLAECQSCAEELSLLRQGRHAESLAADEPFVAQPRGRSGEAVARTLPGWLRWLPVAASLIATVALAGWITTQTQLAELRMQVAQAPTPVETPAPEVLLPDRTLMLSPAITTRGETDEPLKLGEATTLLELEATGFEIGDGPFLVELLDATDQVSASYDELTVNHDLVIPVFVQSKDLRADRTPVSVRVTAPNGETSRYTP